MEIKSIWMKFPLILLPPFHFILFFRLCFLCWKNKILFCHHIISTHIHKWYYKKVSANFLLIFFALPLSYCVYICHTRIKRNPLNGDIFFYYFFLSDFLQKLVQKNIFPWPILQKIHLILIGIDIPLMLVDLYHFIGLPFTINKYRQSNKHVIVGWQHDHWSVATEN
jgi:hypothetical protein